MDKQKSIIEQDVKQKDIQIIEREQNHDTLIKAIEYLQNPKNLESNTILDDNEQVNAIALMNWAGQVFDIEPFKQYVVNWCKYRISSEGGRGRNDVIKIAEAVRRDRLEHEKHLADLFKRS